jgi:hypothetical protein
VKRFIEGSGRYIYKQAWTRVSGTTPRG